MKIVAITSCSTGIAHTYMAAEKLQMEAEAMGHQIKVETQGSIGAENVLTAEDIREADAVLIAANTGVNKDRFVGKRLYSTSVEDGIQKPRESLRRPWRRITFTGMRRPPRPRRRASPRWASTSI